METRGRKKRNAAGNQPEEQPPVPQAPRQRKVVKAKTPKKANSSAKKVKNKVGSPPIRSPIVLASDVDAEDVTSDEFNYNEEEDSISRAGDSGSESESVGSRTRLPHNLQRQLLIDIQNKGGIRQFRFESGDSQALCRICDERIDLYGQRGDKLRTRIGKKVQRWKKLSAEDYLAVLVRFRVTDLSSAPLRETLPADEGLEDSKPAARLPPVAAPPVVVQSPPAAVPSAVSIPSAKTPSAPVAKAVTAERKMMTSQDNTIVYQVNVKKPEQNGPFLVYHVPDMKGLDQSTEYEGFFILYPTDSRFAEFDQETNFYSGKVLNSTQLVFRVPAWPYAMWPKGPNSGLYKVLADSMPAYVQKSMHAAHSVFDSSDTDAVYTETRKWKNIILDFSSVPGIGELSSKVLYADAGQEQALEFSLHFVPQFWEDTGSTKRVTHYEEFVGFKVASVKPEGGRKVARTSQPKSKLAQLREAATRTQGSYSLPVRSSPVPSSVPSATLPVAVQSSATANSDRLSVDEDEMQANIRRHNPTDDEMSATEIEFDKDGDGDEALFAQLSNMDDLRAESMDTEDHTRVKRGIDEANQVSVLQGLKDFGASRLLGKKQH